MSSSSSSSTTTTATTTTTKTTTTTTTSNNHVNKRNDEMRAILAERMKNGQPVLFEVGKLEGDYQDWVHTTRTNKMLRFFESDTLEPLSYCPWWTVPIVWFPVVAYLLWNSAYSNPMDTFRYYSIGFALWPGLEYSLHRYVFHMHTETYWWNTLHFLIHGNHHVSPNDYLRLVFPPAGAAIITAIIGSMIVTLVGKDIGLLLIAGLISGYVSYDLVHFGIHAPNVPSVIATNLRKLKIHHARHHRAINSEYGITNIFLDDVLGTNSLNTPVKK